MCEAIILTKAVFYVILCKPKMWFYLPINKTTYNTFNKTSTGALAIDGEGTGGEAKRKDSGDLREKWEKE